MRPAQTKLESSATESLDEEDEANCSADPDGWLWGAAMKLLGVRDAFEGTSQQGKLKLFGVN